MLMKVFPHGTGEGNKPTRYLVHLESPGRQESPPEVLRGDVAMTCALIDSIERRWKFTSGALSWHPDDKVSPEKEEEVMDAFEQVAFAGLAPDQRNILWVRHVHANAGKLAQPPFFFRRFPKADAKAGLADVFRHAHAVQPGIESEHVTLLRVKAHDNGGQAGGLHSPHAFSCLWDFLRGSKGRSHSPAVKYDAKRLYET